MGGISYNSKTALPNSARFMQNLDIFRDKDSVTLQPGAVKDSGTTVTDLVLWGANGQPWDTNTYFYGNTGKIYKRTSGGVWSVDITISTTDAYGNTISPAGQGLTAFLDGLYYATDKTLGRKYPLDGTPAYSADFLSDGIKDLDLNVVKSGNTYTPPVAISESATDLCSFSPNYDPLKSIQVYVTAKGTGNWTVKVHDAANNVIGTSTVTNANLTNGQMNNFFFPTPLRVSISGAKSAGFGGGQPYHFHVTSTVADGTLQTGTAGDLSTAQYKTLIGILINSAPYHPIMPFGFILGGAGLVIGNANYIAAYYLTNSGFLYDPNLITLDPGFFVRSISIDQGYVVVFADRGTDTKSYQEGRIYYWDGANTNYNISVPITVGVPNTSQSFKGNLYTICGDRGDLYITPQTSAMTRRIQNLPKLSYGKTIEVAPGATDGWQNVMQIGYGINGDDPNFYSGIWSFGTQNDRAVDWQQAAVDVLNFSSISTGNTDSTKVQIGCVLALGQQMFVGWKDTTSGTVYGVDIVTKGANPATTGTFESLIEDRGVDKTGQFSHMPQRNKHIQSLIITFQSLPAGCSVTAKYKLDRAASWTTGNTTSTTGDNHITTPINYDAREIEYGFTITGSGTSAPVITGIYLTYDLLVSESLENFS